MDGHPEEANQEGSQTKRRRALLVGSATLSRHCEILSVSLLLLLALVVFLWPAVLGGRVLVPASLVFDVDPLWAAYAPEAHGPTNSLLTDQVYMYLPWKVLTCRSLAAGQIPLWNPYVNGGQPHIGNAQSAVFSPFNWPTCPLPLAASYAIATLLRLFIAGIFTYLFARETGTGTSGALLAAVAFTFSGPMVVWLGYPLSPVVVWLPALLLTIERAIARRSGAYALASGLLVGAQFLGGHPETSFHLMLVWGAYALYRAVATAGSDLRSLLSHGSRIAAAALLGTALAAVQLAPFAEALLQSWAISLRQAEAAGGSASILASLLGEWRMWPTALTLVLPQYFGSPLDDSYWFPYSNYVEQNAYTGILPFILATVATLYSAKARASAQRRSNLFFAGLAIICLGLALELPVINLVNHLPIMRLAANGRLRLIYAFAVAILAGAGLEDLVAGYRHSRRATTSMLLLVALLSIALIASAYLGLTHFREQIVASGRAFMEANWGAPGFSRSLDYYYQLVEERYARKLALFSLANTVMYVPIVVALCWIVIHFWARKARRGRPIWGAAALGLTLLDLFIVGLPFNTTTAPDQVLPDTDVTRFLEQDAEVFRVVGTDVALNPNTSIVFGLSDIRGYDPIAPARTMQLVERMDGHFRFHFHSLFTRVDSPLLDLLNVKYALTEQQLSGRWQLAYQGTGSVRVYRNRDVLPRAFIVYQAEIVDTAAQSLQRVTDPTFDFRHTAVLEEAPVGWTNLAQPPASPPDAQITDYQLNRVAVRVKTAAPGLLVLSDTYAPGWTARIDGVRAGLYVADHALRAVQVPAGEHLVLFTYQPVWFKIGASITLLALGLTVIAVGALARRRVEDSHR